jgi:DDE superfamily endonuclease
MLTIVSMPRKIKSFFYPLAQEFTRPAWAHFWRLVLALCICHGATIERLTRAMRSPVHRTKHGEFLWKSRWDSAWVIQAIALDTLKRLHRKNGGPCYFVIDETQTLKRAKKMAGVGTLYHHGQKRYATGHTMLKVCLWYRGVTIPWGCWLYLKKDDAPKLKVPFRTLIDLAAQSIETAQLPSSLKVTVLFDSYYLCGPVAQACRRRGWHYIGMAKSNRRFLVQGQSRKLKTYAPNVVRRCGRWHRIAGLNGHQGSYLLAQRIGSLKKLGVVKVVFSRRKGESKTVALVTDDLQATARDVVAAYLRRWAIERLQTRSIAFGGLLLIKDEKQHLGLGDYRVLRYEAVVRHLHLVDCAYGCLTRLALKESSEKGDKQSKTLRMPAISQLKDRMRQVVWQETVEDVIKKSHERAVIRRLERLRAA